VTPINTPDYYRRREAQERALADHAVDPRIRDIHVDMAERYPTLQAEALAAARPKLRIAVPG
jgi:hypothetical protein